MNIQPLKIESIVIALIISTCLLYNCSTTTVRISTDIPDKDLPCSSVTIAPDPNCRNQQAVSKIVFSADGSEYKQSCFPCNGCNWRAHSVTGGIGFTGDFDGTTLRQGPEILSNGNINPYINCLTYYEDALRTYGLYEIHVPCHRLEYVSGYLNNQYTGDVLGPIVPQLALFKDSIKTNFQYELRSNVNGQIGSVDTIFNDSYFGFCNSNNDSISCKAIISISLDYEINLPGILPQDQLHLNSEYHLVFFVNDVQGLLNTHEHDSVSNCQMTSIDFNEEHLGYYSQIANDTMCHFSEHISIDQFNICNPYHIQYSSVVTDSLLPYLGTQNR